MPYWGKTQTEAEDHGPCSKAVFHPKRKDPICIAIETEGYLIFLHNGELHFAEGVIDLCMQVDQCLESGKFGMNEPEVWAAFNEYAAHLAATMR